MPTEIISAIFGLIGVVITYLFMRQKGLAEIEKLKAETDKTKAEAEKIRSDFKVIEVPKIGNEKGAIVLKEKGDKNAASLPSLSIVHYKNIKDAWADMKEACKASETIHIMGIRGLSGFGTDHSLISLSEISDYKNIRKLRILLLSEDSRWLNPGYIQLREYESIEVFKKDLKASHEIMESAMEKLGKTLGNTKSGIKYYSGEPKFAIVITDKFAFINSYAEPPSTQVVDLPIYRLERVAGSLYGAFKRHFNDLWHNQSVFGQYQQAHIDLETSAGGIIIAIENNHKYVALLRRDDGYWVLPKGHRLLTETSLEETARREVIEETGLKENDFYIEKLLGYYTYDEIAERFNATKINYLFLMRCSKKALPPFGKTEFSDAKWWNINTSLPEMLYTYQKSYLYEVIQSELHQKP